MPIPLCFGTILRFVRCLSPFCGQRGRETERKGRFGRFEPSRGAEMPIASASSKAQWDSTRKRLVPAAQPIIATTDETAVPVVLTAIKNPAERSITPRRRFTTRNSTSSSGPSPRGEIATSTGDLGSSDKEVDRIQQIKRELAAMEAAKDAEEKEAVAQAEMRGRSGTVDELGDSNSSFSSYAALLPHSLTDPCILQAGSCSTLTRLWSYCVGSSATTTKTVRPCTSCKS